MLTDVPGSFFLRMLELEQVDTDIFQAPSPAVSWRRVYGGQIIIQAMMAAGRTVERRRLHSLHGYFLGTAHPDLPYTHRVERLHDGRSFAMRQVSVVQNDRPVFSMQASFHIGESGFDHGPPMPVTPGPSEAMSEEEWLAHSAARAPESLHRFWTRERPFELRPVDWQAFVTCRAPEPMRRVWVRARIALPDAPAVHQAMLAYISDYDLLDAALLPYGRTSGEPAMQGASIDHAMWFHRSFRTDRWVLFHQEGITAAHSRGFVRASFFDEEGRLIATATQEGLARLRQSQSTQ